MRTAAAVVASACALVAALACAGLQAETCPEQDAAYHTWGVLAEELPQELPRIADTGYGTAGVKALATAIAINNGDWEEASLRSANPDLVDWPEPWRSRWIDAQLALVAARKACDPANPFDGSPPPEEDGS